MPFVKDLPFDEVDGWCDSVAWPSVDEYLSGAERMPDSPYVSRYMLAFRVGSGEDVVRCDVFLLGDSFGGRSVEVIEEESLIYINVPYRASVCRTTSVRSAVSEFCRGYGVELPDRMSVLRDDDDDE